MKLGSKTFPQRQTTTAFNQWPQSSRRDEPIMKHDSLWTWQCRETPTWAVQWHGRVKWTSTICVCVFMSERVWICASLSKSVLLHVSVPVCISRNAFPVKARVSLSYGQLLSLWLSRQRIAMRGDVGRGENSGTGGGLWGKGQWYTSDNQYVDSTNISHESLLLHPLSCPFRNTRDTKIWMNIRLKQNNENHFSCFATKVKVHFYTFSQQII